ncbi:porin [Shimia sp. R10_1]|uniref:porin n=1 Tax=Shimia sp. R10_1 TaxID=2821095 RepID=UPI001AD9A960|nr:porin [Shimia sp. R10_1]MBO9471992.1 porin [Shimia sp. R10_1]
MTGLKQSVWIAPAAMIAGTVAMSSAAQAEDGFRFYGHLGGAITQVDDGVDSRTEFNDLSASSSRIGAWYERGVAGGTLKFNFETSLGLRGTDSVSQTSNDDFVDWQKTNIRKVEAIYETERFGTFYLGQGSMASDGSAGAGDLSGTDLAGGVAVADTAGGYFFRDAAGNLTDVNIGKIFDGLDGSRRGRVRYDTPTFNGFTVSAAAGTDILNDGVDTEFYDLAVYYENTFGDYEVAGAVSYEQTAKSSNDAETVVASVGTLHTPTGLSANVALGSRDRETGVDSDYVYVKLGLQRAWFAAGRTYLSVDAYRGNDFNSAGDESTSYGIEAAQDIDKANMEVFASYHQHKYDLAGSNFQDVDAFLVGARWKF